MKKFYKGILLELTQFQMDEVIMASPTVGDGDNYINAIDGKPGIGSIGDLL